MVVYCIENLINNKKYIGFSTLTGVRFERYWGSGLLIKQAINKYGIENFKKTIIEESDDYDYTLERERFWIKEMNTLIPIGYNISTGGNTGIPFKNLEPEESKDRFHQRAVNIWKSRRYNGTDVYSEKQLENITEANRRRGKDPTFRAKMKDLHQNRNPKELRYFIWNMLTGELVELVNIQGVKEYIYNYNELMGYKNNKRCNHHLLCHLGHTRDFLMIKKESANYAKK